MSEGADRYRRDRALGIVDRGIGIDDPVTTDNMAYDAEVFFGDQYDGLTSFADAPMPTSCDFSAGDLCIDVKWTKHQRGGLLVPYFPDKPKTHYCTAYVLVIGYPPHKPFRVAGWAWGDEVRESWREDGLLKPAHYIYQDALHDDMDRLMADVFGCDKRGTDGPA